MRSSKVIHVVSCHAEGEVGDVIVGGGAPPPGDTQWEQSRWIAQDDTLRTATLETCSGAHRGRRTTVREETPRLVAQQAVGGGDRLQAGGDAGGGEVVDGDIEDVDDVFAQSLRCMTVEGRICPIGFAGGTIPQIPANILLVKTLAVTGFNYGYYVGWSPHDARFEEAKRTFALMERIRGWCEAGLCRPHVDRTFHLDQAAEAMRALLERSVTGRVAIVMN